MSGYYLSGSLDLYFQQQAEAEMNDEHERCRCGGVCRDCRKRRESSGDEELWKDDND